MKTVMAMIQHHGAALVVVYDAQLRFSLKRITPLTQDILFSQTSTNKTIFPKKKVIFQKSYCKNYLMGFRMYSYESTYLIKICILRNKIKENNL